MMRMRRCLPEHRKGPGPLWVLGKMAQLDKSSATAFTRDMMVMAVSVLAEGIIRNKEEMYVNLWDMEQRIPS